MEKKENKEKKLKEKKDKKIKEEKITEEPKEEIEEEKNNESKDNDKTQKKKNSKKKGLIIVLSVIAVIIIGTVCGYFGYKNYKENKSTGSKWGDLYFDYIKGEMENKKDCEIGFYNSELSKDPMMFATYQENEYEFIALYKIEKDEVKFMGSSGNVKQDVELLYDVKRDKYDYFVTREDEDNYYYDTFDSVLLSITNIGSDNEDYKKDKSYTHYEINKEEVEVSQNRLSGDPITYNKKDEYVIDSKTEIKTISYTDDIAKLNEEITDAVEIIEENKVVSKENDKVVKNKVKEIENTLKEVEKAKEEIAAEEKRKQEEEERKRQEELARGLKVGKYTLKYGTYTSDVSKMDSSMYGTLILQPDGKFHIKANCEGSYPYRTLDHDGTYRITSILNSFTYQDGLEFTTNDGYKFSLIASNNNRLSDQWHGYDHSGN